MNNKMKLKILFAGIIFICIIFSISIFNISNVRASTIYQDGNGNLVLQYPNLPNCLQNVLKQYGFTYNNDIIKGTFTIDYDKYDLGIVVGEDKYYYDDFLKDIPRDATCGVNNQASNFRKLMGKYRDMYLENYKRNQNGFTIYKSLTNKLSFSDQNDRQGIGGEFEKGIISCSSCYVGNILDNKGNKEIRMNNIEIHFNGVNSKNIVFRRNAELVSLDEDGNPINTISEGRRNTLYWIYRVKKGIRYDHAVEGTFKKNGKQNKNGIAELFSDKMGYLIPSLESDDGLAIIENKITDPESGKDYYLSQNYPNYFGSQIDEGGISFSPLNPPTEKESNDLLASILSYLSGNIEKAPEFIPRSTKIEGKETTMYICQTPEECSSYI